MSETGHVPDGADELLAAPRTSRLLRLGYLLGAALLVTGILVAMLTRGHGGAPEARAPSPSPPITAASPSPTTSAPGPSVIGFGHPIPGLTGDFELFARVPNAVLRIDFAAGWMLSTPIPVLASDGPVTFLATSHGALVRPIDAVPGYLVPDDAPAHELDRMLASAAVLPGPNRDQVWIERYAGDRLTGMELVDVGTAAQVGPLLPMPTGAGQSWGAPVTDGSGYVLVSTERGLFDVRPDGAHRLPAAVARATMLAAGSDRLLVVECAWPDVTRCRALLVRLPSGLTRPVGVLADDRFDSVGAISPNGSAALVYQPAAPGQVSARLLDLATGSFRGAPIHVDPDVSAQGAVFSPDSRWLFLVAGSGSLVAVDVATGSVHGMGVPLPNVLQLAVRAG